MLTSEEQLQLILGQVTGLKRETAALVKQATEQHEVVKNLHNALKQAIQEVRGDQWMQVGAINTAAAFHSRPLTETSTETTKPYPDLDMLIREQVSFLVGRASVSDRPMRLYDVLSALTKLQLESGYKVYFSNKGVSALIKEIFYVESYKSNGHVWYRGLKLTDRPNSEFTVKYAEL